MALVSPLTDRVLAAQLEGGGQETLPNRRSGDVAQQKLAR